MKDAADGFPYFIDVHMHERKFSEILKYLVEEMATRELFIFKKTKLGEKGIASVSGISCVENESFFTCSIGI